MARASRDVPPVGDSALALRTASLEPGLSWTLGDPDDDLLVYVAAGAGLLSVGGTSEPVQARSAGLVLWPAGGCGSSPRGTAGRWSARGGRGHDHHRTQSDVP